MKFKCHWALMILLMSTAGSLNAEEGARKPGPPNQDRMFEKLDLSEEQRKKLAEIRKSNAEKVKALQEKLKEAHQKLDSSLDSDASEDVLKKQHQALQDLQNEMSDLRFENILAVRKVLTPEQRKKFSEMRKQKGFDGPRRGGFRDHRREFGDPGREAKDHELEN